MDKYVYSMLKYVIIISIAKKGVVMEFNFERNKAIYEMRKSGATFQEIGDKFSISNERARSVYIRFNKFSESKQWVFTLPCSPQIRTKLSYLYKDKDSLIADILSGKFTCDNVSGINKLSFSKICVWLGIEANNQKTKKEEIAISNAITFLQFHGYKVTKKRAR